MQVLCDRPDGRKNLLQKIQQRFAYVSSFQELYRTATSFHRALSTLFYIQDIVTTNWDDYFERECGAIPLVTAEDFAFWDLPGRKVLKIHGSIQNLGSIVATRDDYDRAHKRLQKGALGSALKLLLATKTVLYVGYSFADDDFVELNKFIRDELGSLAPQAYIVTLDQASSSRFVAAGLQPIYTDATHFIEGLKEHLLEDKHFLPDENFSGIVETWERVRTAHDQLHANFSPHTTPQMIYCAMYQDGLMHALERISDMKRTGEYSHRCHVVEKLRGYEEIRRERVAARKYTDVAYIDGYSSGIMFLLLNREDRRLLPIYYLYGNRDIPIKSLTAYRRALRSPSNAHHAAIKSARKIAASRLGSTDQLHHTPFL